MLKSAGSRKRYGVSTLLQAAALALPLGAVASTVLPAGLTTSCSSNSPDKSREIGGDAGSSGSAGSGATGGTGGTGGTGTGGTGNDGSGGSGIIITDGGPDGDGGEGGGECGGVEEKGTTEMLPVDIIFVIDNSSSMTEEITEVQNRINQNFAQIIEDSKIDYRVIMISRYGKVDVAVGGSDHPVCISSPLGTSDCTDPDNTPLTNGERFFHYSADVESKNAWCLVLEGFNKSDELATPTRPWVPVAPNGWGEFLREKALKTFVVISDDGSECNFGGHNFADQDTVAGGEAAAAEFDKAILALSEAQFGTAEKRKYKWFSIVGLEQNTPPDEPWPATAPITTNTCPAGERPGTGHQAMSVLTEALRYPSCLYQNFDKMFTAIAQSVIEGSGLSCEWEIPPPPNGEAFDPTKVGLCYRPTGSLECKKDPPIYFVASEQDCGPDGGFYFDDPADPKRILVCPTTCAMLQADLTGEISIVFGCKPDIPE